MCLSYQVFGATTNLCGSNACNNLQLSIIDIYKQLNQVKEHTVERQEEFLLLLKDTELAINTSIDRKMFQNSEDDIRTWMKLLDETDYNLKEFVKRILVDVDKMLNEKLKVMESSYKSYTDKKIKENSDEDFCWVC